MEKIAVSFLIVLGGFLIARFLIVPSLVLHELGHLLAAKVRGIPIHGFYIGSGRGLLEFRFLNISWVFKRDMSSGEIRVPRLIPKSQAGWNSILILALAGPATNLVLGTAAALTFFSADHWAIKILAAGMLFVNYDMVKKSSCDYMLARVARDKNLEGLQSMHLTGENAPPVMEIG